MKRFLLYASLFAGTLAFNANAKTQYYASNSLEVYGLLTGISDNGKYAVACDDEDNYAFIWNAEDPTEFEMLENGTLLYDIADDGTAVGAIYQAGGNFRAATYKDGEWTLLGVHPAVLNEQYAIAVTPDARVIAGFEYDRDKNAERGGRYYPVVWILDENGEYEIVEFNDLKLPDHQGFITQTMTPDGKYIGGRLYGGFGSMVPAIIDIDNHKLLCWDEFETRYEPWEYKGKYYAGKDEDDIQIWVDDKDDERVLLYAEQYVNGVHNNSDDNSFNGEFISSDANGNFYGYRTVATNVSEDGNSAKLTNYATIYNIKTGEFTDMKGFTAFSLGYDNGKKLFADNATMVTISESGEMTKQKITDALGFSTSDEIAAITHGSADGKVLGGIYGIFNAAKQAPDYHPFMIILDEPLSGISEISIDNGSDIAIIVAQGRIEVAGANSVAVYDLNGKCVATSASVTVAPGIYVVKADKVSKKVIVK